MSENYYTEVLSEICRLVAEGNRVDAYHRVEEELRMPYIPVDTEKQLRELENEIISEFKLNENDQRNLNEDEIELYLKGNSLQQLKAVETLNSMNLRSQIPLIQSYLISNANTLARALLIDSCIEQEIGEELSIVQDGLEISFIPKYIERACESDGFNLALNYINSWFGNDDPSFVMMSTQVLIQEAYLKYPFVYEEDEGELLAYSIVDYVMKSMKNYQEWKDFVEQHLIDEEKLFKLRSDSV